MAKYYFYKEGKKTYIKDVDFANGTLTFTEDPHQAFVERDGYYAKPMKDQLKRGFKSDYPQLNDLHLESDNSW